MKWLALMLICSPACAADYTALAGQLLSAEHPEVLAVAELGYADGRESQDGRIIAERLTTALAHTDVTVIERAKIEQVLGELKLQRSGVVNQATVKDIGKILGADAVVVGTLTELPERRLELNLRLVSVESGQIVRASSGVVHKDWVTPELKVEDARPISLGELTKPRKNIVPSKAIKLGSGCGCDIYYEGDGSFMRWLQGRPHGDGGIGAYIKREDSEFCNFVGYISQLVEYQHTELKEAWTAYRLANGI